MVATQAGFYPTNGSPVMSTAPVTVSVATLLTLAPRDDARPADHGDSAEVRTLVDAARAGNADAFGALVDLHGRAVVRTARAALGTHEGADDVAQDALVVAWQKLRALRRRVVQDLAPRLSGAKRSTAGAASAGGGCARR